MIEGKLNEVARQFDELQAEMSRPETLGDPATIRRLGKDYTVFATIPGRVRFEHQTRSKKRIRIEPIAVEA